MLPAIHHLLKRPATIHQNAGFLLQVPRAALSTSQPWKRKPFQAPLMPPLPEEELEESYIKGSGPGGQKINKTNSCVQLHHIPTGLYVKCQMTRSREQNRSLARRMLAARVDELRRGDQSRSAVLGEWKRKKKASAAKKSRRKYRKLEQEGQEHEDAGGGAEAADVGSGAGRATEKPDALARGEGTTIG